MKACRTIKYVALQTGVSPHVIRAWEKRYGAIKPARTNARQRLYTRRDVARLKMLRRATEAGHRIGQIARATLPELERLLREDMTGAAPTSTASPRPNVEPSLRACAMDAITSMQAMNLQDALDRAAIELGSPGVLLDFIAPLTYEIGERWRHGELSVAQEHFATNLISVFLNIFARPFAPNESAPLLAVATPSGQHHELGAMLAAAAARSHGWNTTYFGPSLPIEELLRAAEVLEPRAVGLSIVFPRGDQALRADLGKLDRNLAPSCAIILGGSGANGYRDTIRRHSVHLVPELRQLFPLLDRLAGEAVATRRNKASSRS